MRIWPFGKLRRSGKDDQHALLSEKAHPKQQQQQQQHPPPHRAATYPPVGATQPIDVPRMSTGRADHTQPRGPAGVRSTEAMPGPSEKPPSSSQKENVPPLSRPRSSREDITALPMSRRLESSPHLRPVDFERPHIPYNFRPYSESQSSIQRDINISPASPPPRPRKLQSRRSAHDTSTPARRQSSRRSKKDERLREEEIRAMGAHTPIPKRPGEGPLRRDSKKIRAAGMKDSYVSLPANDDDVDSNLASITEQRGWEIGGFDMFNPRPAVRLSGAPQYVSPPSVYSPSPLAEMVRKDKEKEQTPASRERARKRETIGTRADDLDASDIRMLMERDSKRRDQRKKEQQEKLDRKLRNRNGRNRGDSDRKKREAEDARKAEEAKQVEAMRQRDEEETRERLMTPPSDIHPALRNTAAQGEFPTAGLGVVEEAKDAPVDQNMKDHPVADAPEDPFTDAAAEQVPTPPVERMPGAFPPAQTPMETPMETPLETPFVGTAREMSVSQTNTPPLSPVRTAATTSIIAQTVETTRARDLRRPPPITDTRRQSDPKPERRTGAWATFFRRGGTNLRKPSDAASPPSEGSFSNTSRDSMRNQPLPPHLIDTQVASRRTSGTPVRTQSKFREDLPEMPVSPPDSRLPSPDVTTAAAAAAVRRRQQRSSAPVALREDLIMDEAEPSSSVRNDTPVSPSIRSNRMASMASLDSEGSWLASGSPNRHSTQSGVHRSIGSLNQRFTGSYEELGGDRDAEYVQRGPSSPDKRTKLRSSALAGAGPDEETDEDEDDNAPAETPGDPISMHESVRRQPTLVHRDPRVKSREGLLTEYSEAARGDTPEPTSAISGGGSILGFDEDDPEPQIKRASSVDYKGHARQISAGSARLIGLGRTNQGEATPPMPQSPTSTPRP